MYINKQTINPSYRNLQFFNHISFRSLPRHVRYTHWHLHPAAATLPQWAVSPSWMLGTGEGNGICHGFLVSLGVGGWDSLGLEMGERRKSWVERGKKRADWGEVHNENVKREKPHHVTACWWDHQPISMAEPQLIRFQTMGLKLGMDKIHTSFIYF